MRYKTKAAVLFETGKPLQVITLTLPEPQAGQLVVKVEFSGLCHTQLGEVRGRRGPDQFLPHSLGHEGSGIVIAVGEGVTKGKPGDHVVLSWLQGDGQHIPGTKYQSEFGEINSGAISTFMEKTVVPESKITVIPPTMPMPEAALLGCAIPTGCGIIKNDANVKKGDSVAVFGVGGIGLSAVLGCVMLEASTIIAIDLNPEKLDVAKSLGATHVVNSKNSDVLEEIQRITDNKGVDYAVEATGLTDVMAVAFRSVRDFGGLCVVAGNPEPGEHLCLDPYDLIKGKKIIGSWGGGTNPDQDIPFYLQAYRDRKLPLEKLISKTYSLDNINEALGALERGEIVRALISMEL